MLAGQRSEFIPALGEFINLSAFLDGDEQWRQNPVFSNLKKWYDLNLAKLTENLPVLRAIPATSDTKDAKLAEFFDPIFRYEWQQMRVPEQMFAMMGWMLTTGRFVVYMRWDMTKGPTEDWAAPEQVEIPDGSGGVRTIVTPQEYGGLVDAMGNPMGAQPEHPHTQSLGDMTLDVLPPTAVLWPFGPEPCWQKPWMIHDYLLHVDEIKDRFGIEVEPDSLSGQDDLLSFVGFTDPYGMPSSQGGWGRGADPAVLEGMKRCRARWSLATAQDPHGRVTIVTREKRLWDAPNPYVIPGEKDRVLIPYYSFDRVGYPFRQEGLSDLEVMNPIARARDRRGGAMMDSADYLEQSLTIFNKAQLGDLPDEAFNRKCAVVGSDFFTGQAPVIRLDPPGLPQGSLDLWNLLEQELKVAGNMDSTVPAGSSSDPSGELLRQMRFDIDRPLSSTLRYHSYIWARVGEDLAHILGCCCTDDRLLSMSGEDNAWTFLEVGPELFRGSINVEPVLESAVLETRQDKQNRIVQAFTQAAELSVQNPELAQQFLKVLNYPDVVRATRPGGEAYSLAKREMVEMFMSGQPAPVWPEQNHDVHIQSHEEDMQGTKFRDADPIIQQAVRLHLQIHYAARAVKAVQQGAQAAAVGGANAQQVVDNTPDEMKQDGADPSAKGAGPSRQSGAGPAKPQGQRPQLRSA